MTDKPLYLKAFEDYDDVLTTLPGMIDTSWHNDTNPSFANEVAGFRLWCGYKNITVEERHDLNLPGHRFQLLKIHDPENMELDTPILTTDDFFLITVAYAKAWLEWVTTEGIGIGFHIDTSADQYEPPLAAPLSAQYDELISLAHRHLVDPYEVAYDAAKKAGFYEPLDKAAPPAP